MITVERIADKTIRGTIYNGVASSIAFILSFLRTIFMARLLLPEHFGAVALAAFFVNTVNTLMTFGLSSAFIHSRINNEALKQTFFSIQCALLVLKFAIILGISPLLQRLYPEIVHLQGLLIGLSLTSFIAGLSFIQSTIMRKEMDFSSLAIIEVISSIVVLIIGPLVAWIGWGAWALVAEQASNALAHFSLGWGPFRRWKPSLGWNRQSTTLFKHYAKPTWIRINLDHLLDRFDDFWIGSSLGQVSLGFYDKAYYFACSPRRIVAMPLVKIFEPVFARLQDDRKRLSIAYSQSAYLLVRIVFCGAGWFAMIMPEFINQVIGTKWLPMLWTFRLLLLYATLDSLRTLIQNLFTAVGHPALVRNTSIIQIIFFVPAVILGTHLYDINGAAIAADGMLLIGIAYLHFHIHRVVDISSWRLFGWPVLALGLAAGMGLLIENHLSGPPWQTALLKSGIFLTLFCGILILAEGKAYYQLMGEIKTILKSSRSS